LIVALVGHGFSFGDLMEMGGAEILFWADGLKKHNAKIAKAQKEAQKNQKPKKKPKRKKR
jgi:hypothetical protein